MSETTKLTMGELAVLLHRLEGAGSHCIAESLKHEVHEYTVFASIEEIENRADSLLQLIKELHGIPAGLPYLEREVLINCVECATCHYSGTNAENAITIRKLKGLAAKMITAGVAERIDVKSFEEDRGRGVSGAISRARNSAAARAASEEITMDEVLKLVSFRKTEGGRWQVEDIHGNVGGHVWGNVHRSVHGRINGCVFGDIKGDVIGSIRGKVAGVCEEVSDD